MKKITISINIKVSNEIYNKCERMVNFIRDTIKKVDKRWDEILREDARRIDNIIKGAKNRMEKINEKINNMVNFKMK